MKKIAAIIFLIIFINLLPGCSFITTDIQELMSPPRPTGDKADIQSIIEENGGTNYIFKYPKRGKYRSAVIMFDIDADGQDEAIAFYKINTLDSSDISMIIMDEDQTGWKKIANFTYPAVEVDKISFAKLYDQQKYEIIVGWQTYNSISDTINVYKYEGQNINAIDNSYAYSDFAVMDFDSDSFDEVLLLSLSTSDDPATARLMKYNDKTNKLDNIGQADMDPAVIKYASISQGLIAENQSGIAVDGNRSSSQLITEVVYWDKNKSMLKAPVYESLKAGSNPMLRTTQTVSQDMDKDGLIDIPEELPVAGYNTDNSIDIQSSNVFCITRWNRYGVDSNKFLRFKDTVMNYNLGYYLTVPEEWEKTVVTAFDKSSNVMTFSEWTANANGSEGGSFGAAILKLSVFLESDWDYKIKNKSDFNELKRRDGKIYVASLLQPDNPNSLTLEYVLENFHFIDN